MRIDVVTILYVCLTQWCAYAYILVFFVKKCDARHGAVPLKPLFFRVCLFILFVSILEMPKIANKQTEECCHIFGFENFILWNRLNETYLFRISRAMERLIHWIASQAIEQQKKKKNEIYYYVDTQARINTSPNVWFVGWHAFQ